MLLKLLSSKQLQSNSGIFTRLPSSTSCRSKFNALWPWSPPPCVLLISIGIQGKDNECTLALVSCTLFLLKCRQHSILAMLHGQLQTVQHCGNAAWTSADSTAFWQCCIGKEQTVQHFGHAVWTTADSTAFRQCCMDSCRQYSILAMMYWESADSKACGQCCMGKVQTVQHFGNALREKVQTVQHVGNVLMGKCRPYGIFATEREPNLSRCSFVMQPPHHLK